MPAATCGALPIAGLYAAFRALLRARTRARHARPRPAGAPGGAGRRRPRRRRRAAPAARQPPADRGVHGAGQRLRRRGAGAAAPALHLSRPRPALGREAGRPARLPAQLRHRPAGRAATCARATSTACCSRSPAPSTPAGQRGDAAQPERRPPTPRTISAISAWRCRATRISPARSAATPTCSCTAR